MDEDLQAGRSIQVAFDSTLINKAAQQQQPPLDYYAQGICFKILGVTPFAARIHSVFFGTFATVIFSLLLIHLFERKLTVILGIVAFATNPYLIRYAQEGRPISCSIFFGTLYLYLIVTRILVVRRKHSCWSTFLLFFTTQFCFLLSVGFQPIVYIATSSLTLLPLLLYRKYRLSIGIHFVGTVAAFVAALPILLRTIIGGRQLLNETHIPGLFVKLFANFWWPKPQAALEKITSISGYTLFLWGIIIVIGLMGIFLTRSLDRSDSNQRVLTAYVSAFFCMFLFLFDIMFYSLISYRVTLRYYMVITPVFILLGVLFWDWGANLFSFMQIRICKANVVRYLFILLFVLLNFVQIYETFRIVYFKQENEGWRELYSLFNDNRDISARAYMMNLTRIDRYHPYFFSQRFYYTESPRPVALFDADKIPQHILSKSFLAKTKKVFVCTMYGNNKIKNDYFKSLSYVKVHSFTALSAIEVEKRDDLRAQLITVFRLFGNKASVKEDNYKLFSILFELEYQDGNLQGMNANLQKLISMDKRNKLSNKIAIYKNMERKFIAKKNTDN
jgi:hypothetical protein